MAPCVPARTQSGFPAFDAAAVLEAIERHRATIFMGVPTYYHRLLQTDLEGAALDSIRLFTSGSAGLPATDWHAFRDRTGHAIVERYGMTEVGIVVSNPLEDPRPGEIGLPLPTVEARVVGLDRAPVPADTIGELEIAGPSVFAGYLGRPDATAEALVDGWMRTGDLAERTAEGRIRLVGRRSEVVIRGGLNIYPAEVEAVLLEQDGVHEAAVFGIPDAALGERVLAAVVCSETLDLGVVATALEGRLARFKLPERLIRVSELPRNAMGKVQKHRLTDAHRAV